MSEPACVFLDQEHISEATTWLEDDVVLLRVGSSGTTMAWDAQEARHVGLALQELGGRAERA